MYVCVSVCVCMYVCMCVCMYVCMLCYVCTYVCMYECALDVLLLHASYCVRVWCGVVLYVVCCVMLCRVVRLCVVSCFLCVSALCGVWHVYLDIHPPIWSWSVSPSRYAWATPPIHVHLQCIRQWQTWNTQDTRHETRDMSETSTEHPITCHAAYEHAREQMSPFAACCASSHNTPTQHTAHTQHLPVFVLISFLTTLSCSLPLSLTDIPPF